MKRLLAFALIAIIFAGCGKQEPEPTPQAEWKDTYNGQLLLGLAGAFDTFESTGALPSTIKWEGVPIFKQEYMRAGLALLVKILDEQKWYNGDVTYSTAIVSLVSPDQPFLPKEITFSEFEPVIRTQNTNIKNGQLATRIKVGSYEEELTSNALLVMICRCCASYRNKGAFPDKIDTWETTYLVPTNNCQVNDPLVKTTRDAAWKAANVTEASTEREKAVAIFNYARDQWTWENYNNTKKGAVGTINAKGGNCCDLSHAVVAMSRLSGIPARYFHAQCHYSSGYIGHVISQLFVDGKWEYADASNDGNTFGKVSFTYYYGLHYYEQLDF